MKKFLNITLAIAMILTMGSVTAFAATTHIGPDPGSSSGDVYGVYEAGSGIDTIYSVDVEWESLEFTYTPASAGTWDPATHTYTGGSALAGWSSTTNKITVTNHSNTAVVVGFKYNPTENIYITGSFSGTGITSNSANLPSAVGLATNDATLTVTAELTLTGTLSSSNTQLKKLGYVRVTIT